MAQLMAQFTVLLIAAYAIGLPYAQAQDNADSEKPPPQQQAPGAAKADIVQPQFANRHERDWSLLSADHPFSETLTTPHEDIVVVYRPDTSGSPVGAALIIHTEGAPPFWPEHVKALQQQLPDNGWGTLSLLLPMLEQPAPPPRPLDPSANTDITSADVENTDTDTENTETGNNDTEDTPNQENPNAEITKTNNDTPKPDAIPHAERVRARLRAALQFMAQKGQFNIAVIGDSISSAYISELLAAEADKSVRAMIVLHAHTPINWVDIAADASLNNPERPTLDIFFDLNHPARQARRQTARQQQYVNYRQYLLRTSRELSRSESLLTRRIRGFLNKAAKGKQVKNDATEANNNVPGQRRGI